MQQVKTEPVNFLVSAFSLKGVMFLIYQLITQNEQERFKLTHIYMCQQKRGEPRLAWNLHRGGKRVCICGLYPESWEQTVVVGGWFFYPVSSIHTHTEISLTGGSSSPRRSVSSQSLHSVSQLLLWLGRATPLPPHHITPLLQAAELNLTSGCHRLHSLSAQLCISTFNTLSFHVNHLMAFILKCDLLYIIITLSAFSNVLYVYSHPPVFIWITNTITKTSMKLWFLKKVINPNLT